MLIGAIDKKSQQGVFLLEALIAILVFSMGILAVVGLQASAIKVSTDAKYRSDASLLANELIGQMWTTDRAITTLQANFAGNAVEEGSVTPYNLWASQVLNALPGVNENPPIVTVTQVSGADTGSTAVINSSLITITVRWQSPNDTDVHRYVVSLQIPAVSAS